MHFFLLKENLYCEFSIFTPQIYKFCGLLLKIDPKSGIKVVNPKIKKSSVHKSFKNIRDIISIYMNIKEKNFTVYNSSIILLVNFSIKYINIIFIKLSINLSFYI